MMSIKQLSRVLEQAKLKNVSEETGVSVHYLRKIQREDGAVPYSALQKLSDYYEGNNDDE